MGTGGAPEGVLTAAAMRCLNGEIFARLVIKKPEDEERCRAMGITDPKQDLPLEGSRVRQADHLRRDRRDRRHADARRALLRRRHPHELAHDAERSRRGSASSTPFTSNSHGWSEFDSRLQTAD